MENDSKKNKELESKVQSLTNEYDLSWIPGNVYAISILEFTVIHGMEMCFCELKAKAVGSFGSLSSSPWFIDELSYKWLFLQTVTSAYPSIGILLLF